MTNGNVAYWQAALAADAKEEVSWSWSDGPGLDPAVALAAANASRAATAAARTGAAVAAGVEAARVNIAESHQCRDTSNSAGALQVG